MSICLAQDSLTTSQQIIGAVIALVVAAAVGALLRVYRPSSVLGPARLAPDHPLWPIGASALIGTIAWFGIQVMFASAKMAAFMKSHPGEPFDLQKHLTPQDYAFLATLPGIVS